MRKRGLPYVLAAMMLIGSTGIGGNYVRADEPAVTEEGEIETTETEESSEEINEGVTEEVTEETTEDVIGESTEENTTEAEVDNIITDDSFDSEDSPTLYNWYRLYDHYEVEIDEDTETGVLYLYSYNDEGYTDTEIYVPAKAYVNGYPCVTRLRHNHGYYEYEENHGSSIWAARYGDFVDCCHSDVEKITIDPAIPIEDMEDFFNSCVKLKSFSMEGNDTSKVRNLRSMFYHCESIESVDLSGLELKDINNIGFMFLCCYNLKSVNFGSMTLSKSGYTYVESVFADCIRLETIDMHSLDFSNVTSTCMCLDDCKALKTIQTPYNVKVDIKLPHTMYDASGNVYTTLPKNLDHSIKISTDKSIIRNGWKKVKGVWKYYVNGKLYNGVTILAKVSSKGDGIWWATSDGTHDVNFTGIAQKNTNGHWRFARNGVMDLTYSGLAQNTNGNWFYVKDGCIDTSFTNQIAPATNGKFYYVLKGRPNKAFDKKIAYCPSANKWYYCTKGVVDFKFSGKVAPCTDGNRYYVTKGTIDKSFTGIAVGVDGKKYYVVKGKVDVSFTGIYTYQGKNYNVVKGVVK